MNGDKTIREQLGSVQVSFDKEAAWDRLHERLDTKSTSKKYYRLGGVAAALLLMAVSVWDFASKEKTVDTVVKKQYMSIVPANKEQTIITSNTVEINPQKAPTGQNQAIKISDKQTQLTITPQQQAAPHEEIVVEVMQEAPARIEEQPIAVAKPKMKVLHINEVMEEERIERRVLNSRYAKQDHFNNNYSSKFPIHNKQTVLHNLNEEYKLMQN